MGDTGQPPGAGPPVQPDMTPEQTGDGTQTLPKKMRTFEEIVAEEKNAATADI